MHERRIIFTAAADARLTFAAPAADEPGKPASIGTLKGYALVFNKPSTDRGGFKVRLMPGSAKFTPQAHALNHHGWTGGPLGDVESGTLRILPADTYGVPVEIDLPNTSNGRDTLELVKSGRMKGMSFGMVESPYVIKPGEPGKPMTIAPRSGRATVTREGGETFVNALDYLVDEVTVTADPAFPEAQLAVYEDEPVIAGRIAASAGAAEALRFARYRHDLYRLE